MPLPPIRKAIGCKWVFQIKRNVDGSIQRYKARLVAKGFSQREGFDYHETFSPVVKPTSIRIVLTLAFTYGWSIHQLDVHNVFLNGYLEEEVFMKQPPGFEQAGKSLVCRLDKALYGLKQAPRAWFGRLNSVLRKFGSLFSKCDNSLFIKRTQSYKLFILVYVDDIL